MIRSYESKSRSRSPYAGSNGYTNGSSSGHSKIEKSLIPDVFNYVVAPLLSDSEQSRFLRASKRILPSMDLTVLINPLTIYQHH